MREDPLAPARGCVLGIALGTIAWVVAVALWKLL